MHASALCFKPSAGYNGYGQLGDNTTTSRKVPTTVTGNATWSALPNPGSDSSLGVYGFTCAIMTNKTLACWVRRAALGTHRHFQLGGTYAHRSCVSDPQGYNGNSQLGDGTTTNSQVPVALGGLWLSVGQGAFHACGLSADFKLFCWVRDVSCGVR